MAPARCQDLLRVNQGLGFLITGVKGILVPTIFAVGLSVMPLVFWDALGCLHMRYIARCVTSENPIDVSVSILLIEVACLIACLGQVYCGPAADSTYYPSFLIFTFTHPSVIKRIVSAFPLTW